MAGVMDFKFGTHVPRVGTDTTPGKIFEKRTWPGSRDPVKFWAVNANNSKKPKGTNFKFGKYVLSESLDITPEKVLEMGVARVT